MSTPRRLARKGDVQGKPTGRWQARISVMRDGKSTQVSLGTFATKRDALDAQHTELAKIRAGSKVDPASRKMTVRAFAEQWYSLRRTPSRKVRGVLDSRIIPHFGDRRLGDVTAMDVQSWVNNMTAAGLSPVTVRDYYAVLNTMYSRAVEYELLAKSPCRLRVGDLPRQHERRMVVLTVNQLRGLEAASPARYRAMTHLAAWGGLRWGELAALRWEDVDLAAGVVHVRRAVKEDGTVGTPKNGKTRKVVVGPGTVEMLTAHRRDFGLTELLFTTTRQSRPLTGGNFRKNVWGPTLDRAGFTDERPGFHQLRHAHAGHMVMQGMDWKVLSDRLGHHKPSFTMDRYGWIRPDSDTVTLEALEKAMQS